MSLFADTIGGGNIVHDLGFLESGLSYSLAQLAVCDDVIGWIRAFVSGAEISAETMALDEIHKAGPEGQFLDHPHTRRHYRERYYPNLLDRNDFQTWQGRGGKTMTERAAERVERILAEHCCEPLPADVAGRLRQIVQRAESRH